MLIYYLKTITCRPRKEQLSDPQNKLEIFTFVEGVGEAEARDKGKSWEFIQGSEGLSKVYKI